MKWATVRRHQKWPGFVSTRTIARIRGLETSVVLWSWGLRPRLYARACFAG